MNPFNAMRVGPGSRDNIRIRRLLARAMGVGVAWTLSVAAPAAPSAAELARTESAKVQVWVELDMPPLAAQPASPGMDAAALARKADLVRRIKDLGAIEIGSVRVLRHAIAVEVPADRIEALGALDGVRRVTPVRHVDRLPPVPAR